MIEIKSTLLENYLQKLENNLEKRRKIMDALGMLIKKSVKERFVNKTDPEGNPWERNRPSTIAKKGRDDPLVDTGKLKKSVYMKSDKDGFMVYTEVPYAGFHQSGTDRFTARPFMGFSEEDEKNSIDLIRKEMLT